MKRIILALAMLAMLAVMALPAMAQPWGGDDYGPDDYYGHGGHDDDDDYDRGDYHDDYGPYSYDNWWDLFYNQDSCDWYWSIWGQQYWCWSPLFGWYQLY